jgi:hypothetical protein
MPGCAVQVEVGSNHLTPDNYIYRIFEVHKSGI